MVPHKAITNQVGGIRLKLLSLLLLLLLLLLFSNNLLLITKLTIKTYLQSISLKKKKIFCERFEPRSHFKRLSLIVRVNVVLNRSVVVDSD